MSPEESKFIEALYKEHSESLWRYALTCLHDQALADEILSDVFHVAMQRVESLISHEYPEGWLLKVLRYKLKHYRNDRRKYAMRFLALDEEILRCVPVNLRPTEEQAERDPALVEAALEKIKTTLSAKELYVLRRVTLAQATHKAVSQELGISVWDSQKALQRARQKLRALFPDYKKGKGKK